MGESAMYKSNQLSTSEKIGIAVRRTLKQILMIDLVRYLITYPRRLWYMDILRKVKYFDIKSQNINPHTPRNFKAVKDTAVIRSNQLLRPLSVIEPVYSNPEKLDVLSIGPRTEGEILNLVAHGFSRKKIKALDLFSYSSWIDVGDMHKMPYHDCRFDVLVSGFTLAYSDKPQKAADEMLRVARDGAVMAIGVSFMPESFREKMMEKRGFVIATHLFCIQDILKLFEGHVDQIYFSQDVNSRGKERGQNLLVIFTVKK
jgi:SAM-dependent methyltransferase